MAESASAASPRKFGALAAKTTHLKEKLAKAGERNAQA